jgi:uncharacterized protein (DUF2141 family)
MFAVTVFCVFIPCLSQNLIIAVTGIEEIKGNVNLGLYNSHKTFMKIPVISCSKKVRDKTVVFQFDTIVSDGKYAVSVYHDTNLNGKLDTGLFGVPLEKYGFSNNAKGFAGAPSFRSSSFEVRGKKEISIILK